MFTLMREESIPFLDKIFLFVKELDIDVSGLAIDHMALRYRDRADVDKLILELANEAKLLTQAVVNGRKIYIFKLHQPIVYKSYEIPCIELPYPAVHHDYPVDGWEHVEFVLPAEDAADLELVFKRTFPQLTHEILKKYGYELAVPNVEGEQLPNPTIVLTKYKGLTVKFHPNSIEKVVTS